MSMVKILGDFMGDPLVHGDHPCLDCAYHGASTHSPDMDFCNEPSFPYTVRCVQMRAQGGLCSPAGKLFRNREQTR